MQNIIKKVNLFFKLCQENNSLIKESQMTLSGLNSAAVSQIYQENISQLLKKNPQSRLQNYKTMLDNIVFMQASGMKASPKTMATIQAFKNIKENVEKRQKQLKNKYSNQSDLNILNMALESLKYNDEQFVKIYKLNF